MKILQIHNFYRIAGGECGVVRAERALLEAHGNDILPYYRDSREIDDWGVVTQARMLLNIPYSRLEAQSVSAFVRETRPDVAHVHNVFPLLTPAVYPALQRHGIPVVQTVHNFRLLCPNGLFYINEHICQQCQERSFFSAVRNRCMQRSFLVSAAYAAAVGMAWKRGIIPNGIDRYIALNHFFAQRLIAAGVPGSRVRVLGNFTPERLHNVPPKENYVLFLGRLSREKGIRTLMAAWKNITGSLLRIAGSGPLRDEIARWAESMGRGSVELLGHVTGDAKRALIRGAKCLVVPSEWYENFPLSIVEALSQGTPVVASDLGGLPELVRHGVNGLIFKAGDCIALEQTLRRLLAGKVDAQRLAERALVSAADALDAEQHHAGLIDIYTQAIQSKASQQ